METLRIGQNIQHGTQAIGGLPDLISAIGKRGFEAHLLSFLNAACGAEYCAIFELAEGVPLETSSASLDGTDAGRRQVRLYVEGKFWRRDPMMAEARRLMNRPHPSIIRLPVHRLPDSELRHLIYGPTRVCERVIVCGGSPSTTLGLSVLRSERRGMFDTDSVSRLGDMASALLSILAKHTEVSRSRPDPTPTLASLDEIMDCIASATVRFPRRETEVCARIIIGQSSLGTAIDLGIGEQTVLTYRKRIYQRLSICSQRELLLWYVKLWNETRYGAGGSRPRSLQ